ncbi:MAG: phosphoheptose isomerase [Chloroflexi bacterium]|nr:MAG: phosphoheptose isomerase [Chloroflexota bacterium]
MDREAVVKKQLEDGIELKRYMQQEAKVMVAIAQELIQALRNGKKVLVFGNGGSAADAQHIAAELAGRFYRDRPSLPAIALTTNTSSLTAIANDYGYDTVFARQCQGLVAEGDVVIAISTGGNSPNVVLAIEEAKRRGAVTIGLSGKGGGKLAELADYTLSIPSGDTPRIQEAHITAGHIICHLVEEALFGEG